ncbi:cysteine methyltransferase [Arthrobacter sp. JZ12]|uniref:MGMT family protein n=1 Tax=Arthrobacter sp. JZ12 TaxID=2654190 RepID=UPI002B465743|nr:MGMT family protein [Arthrobacter sp. JZ12]WRH25443.1 cysteine methyltransferase [Arthrobacter sp. JZ12]
MRNRGQAYGEAVLDVVRLVPPGKVLTYGDIAEILEVGGPRQVGSVLSRSGADVPWWRVLRADGRPPTGLEADAVEHYLAEDTALRASEEQKVDLVRARWLPRLPEQEELQRIRQRLARALAGGAPEMSEMSEVDDGVGS